MGVQNAYNHKLYHPGASVLVCVFCAWILISAMPPHVFLGSTFIVKTAPDAGENQTQANVPTNTSSGNTTTAGDEVITSLTESAPSTSTIIVTTNATRTNNVTNKTNIDDTDSDTSTTNTTYDSSTSQSEIISQSTSLLLTTDAESPSTETTTDITTKNPISAVTQLSTHSSSGTVTVTAKEGTDVTNNSDFSITTTATTTTTYQNTGNSTHVDNSTHVNNSTYASGFSTLEVLVAVFVAVTACVVMILVVALIVYFHRDRCYQRERQTDDGYSDCDHELYSTVNMYTNFRHHGARAEFQPLNLKDEKLITKMEVDEAEDDTHTDNTGLDVEDSADSGRYVSPEGLVYVTVTHELVNGKTKSPHKKQEDDSTVQYASVDIDKTNKLFIKQQQREQKRKKKKRAESKKKKDK